MTRDDVRDGLVDILTSPQFQVLHLNPSEVHDDTSLLNDVGMDSLQLLAFIVEIEKRFGFRIGSGDVTIDTFDRFDRIIDLVRGTSAIEHT